MARPTDERQARDRTISLRLTQSALGTLDTLRGPTTRSDYIRALIGSEQRRRERVHSGSENA